VDEIERNKRKHKLFQEYNQKQMGQMSLRHKSNSLRTMSAHSTKQLLEQLITFIKSWCGRLERIFEDIFNAPTIKCKHTPLYNGSFNGNETERLLELICCLWMALRASLLADRTSDEEKIGVEALIADHKSLWGSFKIIMDLYRTTCIFTKAKQPTFLNEIK
jgi:hypothetical protein